MRRFCQDFGERLAAGIDSTEIVRWLAGPLPTQWERMNHRRILSVFFAYCKGIGATTINPVDDVPKLKLPVAKCEIFSVPEARKLLLGALEHEPVLVPWLAIGLFAGLRTAELERLDWSDVTDTSIRIEPATSKTASRHVVELSANLLKWLLPYRKASGPIIPPGNYRNRCPRLSVITGIRWRSNGLRHSFASYHLAAYENSGKTALALGHSNPNLFFRHYRELVSAKEALAFWNLVPPTKEQSAKLVAFT
jgi:integrase